MADKKGTGGSPRKEQASTQDKSDTPKSESATTGPASTQEATTSDKAANGKADAKTASSRSKTPGAAKSSTPRKSAASKSASSKTASTAATSSPAASAQSSQAGETASADPAKPEAGQPDTAKPEAAKTGATKAEAAKTDTAKTEAEKSTASGSDAARPASSDAKTTSTSVPKTEAPRSSNTTPSGNGTKPARPAEPGKSSGGGFFALLLGGVCAAAIGFGAAYYILPQTGLMPTSGGDASQLIDEQASRIDALEQRLADLPAASEAPDLSGIEGSQQTLEENIAALSQQIEDLTGRLDQLESQPAGSGGGASPAQLNSLRSALEQQGEQLAALTREAEERENAAQTAARDELRRAALTRIRTALDTGSEFVSALGDLERSGMSTPDALQEVAEAGVPTEQELQDEFAPAARAALAAARQSGADGAEPGIWSFMSDQLGARSLERKEGPGVDAVLSRAEDDLNKGNLESALTEIDSLPEPARADLSDWADAARARMQALDAHDALAAKLN